MLRKVQLVLDLGNSETRAMILQGKDAKGRTRRNTLTFSNQYATLPDDYVVPQAYLEDSDVVEYEGQLWAHGSIVDAEFSDRMQRPTAIEKKYNSRITEVTLREALYQAMSDIADRAGEGIEDSTYEWDITVLLPPNDIALGKQPFTEKILGITELVMRVPEVRVDVTVNSVNVVPEGSAAFMGAIFEEPGAFFKGADQYIGENVLVIDIGAGTTDFCIVKGGRIQENSKDSLEIGGNNVQAKVKQLLRQDSDFGNFSPNIVRTATETGYIKMGTRQISIAEKVNRAKEEVAQDIVQGIISYFESVNMKFNEIAYVLLCGGGSIEVDGLTPIAEPIVEYLKQRAKYVEIMPVPEKVSPRDLNIYGAGIIALMAEARKQSE